MSNNNLPKAQSGITTSPKALPTQGSLLDEVFMQQRYGSLSEPVADLSAPYFRTGNVVTGTESVSSSPSALANLYKTSYSNPISPSGGGKRRTLNEFADNAKSRYDFYMPGDFDNEDAYAQQQGFGEKMVNGIGKGLILTGTTFLQSTVGLAYGTIKAISDGKFSSFFDNELTRGLDKINKLSEDAIPNYYTREERDAVWYSPKYWATGNFLWDGVVKNLGFAAGAALSGRAYTLALKALPISSRLFASGKAVETLAATEAELASAASAGKTADIYGKLLQLNKEFAGGYNSLNRGGRFVVSGLSTTGEAGIEGLHNSNEFRNTLIEEYKEKYGVPPSGADLEKINISAEAIGNWSFFLNTSLLLGSNYIQFPKILGSTYKGEKNIINGLVREIDGVTYTSGKYIIPPAKYPKLSKLDKIRPYTFSVTESLEEVSQYSIGVGTEDYYKKQYNGEATDWLESLSVGITEGAFSNEGAKNALIGGISGALMQSRGRFIQDRAKRKNTSRAINEFNKRGLFQFTKETWNSINRGTVLQQEREQAIKDGDILNSKDLEADYIINYLTPRVKYGRYDLVKADIAEYKKLASTEEGFAQLVSEGKALETDTREAYTERLNRLEQTADNVKSLWESLNLRYGSQLLTDENGKPILTKDGKRQLKYSTDVMNKMIYAANKVVDYDQRLLDLLTPLNIAGINTSEVINQLVNGKTEAFNEAIESIKQMDIIEEEKETLAQSLEDASEIALRRQSFLKEYQNIKENPSEYKEFEPVTEEEIPTAPVETVKVKTKQGEKDVEIGTEYFAGKGVDYSKDPLDSPVPISRFTVMGVNENGTLKIKNLDTGKESDISPDKFENLKVGKVSTLQANKTANYYYNHRNEIFEYRFPKQLGGSRRGRLEYQDGKLYFVYLTPTGKVARKEVNNFDFVSQESDVQPRIETVETIENELQKLSREEFTSPEEIAKQKSTLAKNRESRIEVLAQLGEEAKETLEETNKKLAQQTEKLTKIKEDLENIAKMKEAGPKGPKIKLNFSKATKVFTKALNNLTAMQADVQAEIEKLTAQKKELEFNLSYFETFANEFTDGPENGGEFLKELKDEIKLLEDNGSNLNKVLVKAKKLNQSIEKAIKSAAKLFRKTLKSTYIVDQDYSQYLSDLLDQVVAGENLLETWPLLKQEMANFTLTADLTEQGTVDEVGLLESIDDIKQIEEELNELRTEYKARKAIIDRFQSIMDEYLKTKKNKEELVKENSKKTKSLLDTANTSQQTISNTKEFEPESKKPTEVILRATTFGTEGTVDQLRANKFGMNFHKMPESKRKNMRGVYVTLKTEAQLGMSGLIKRMLSTPGDTKRSKEAFEKFKDSSIVMVIVNDKGEVVNENGDVIPTGNSRLDNAIYQVYPDNRITSGDAFRKDVPDNVKRSMIEQYKNWRTKILSEDTLGELHTIGASFGIPQYKKDENNKKIYSVTSVKAAGLIKDVDLEKSKLIYVPKVGESVEKGTTKYENVPGTAFLNLPEAFVKLRNRLLTNKEANTIFESILQLSKNLENPSEGINSDGSKRILNFLKGIVYWGIPKDQNGQRKDIGFNSVFFERDPETGMSQLVISNNNNKFLFDPKSLEMNKTEIIQSLENIYNNIDASPNRIGDLNTPFEEITSVSPDGEIKSTIWPNYQTYILSDKGREDFELPVHVTMRPLENEDDVNREGFYFFTTDNIDDFKIPKGEGSTLTIPEGTNANLNGETPNNFPTVLGDIQYIAPDDLNNENYNEKIELLPSDNLEQLKTQKGVSDQQIKAIIYNSLLDDLARINREKAQPSQPSKEVSEQKTQFLNRVFKKDDSPTSTKAQEQEQKKKEEVINSLFKKADEKSEEKNGKPIDESVKNSVKNVKSIPRNREALRVALNNRGNVFEKEDWNKVESWLNKNFPNIPVYRVKNIIQATNGRQAWGMFKDGAIYVYQNAEVGTAYHEVFEAVWKMFTSSEEQAEIINEFKERKGTFVDRPTRKTVKYSEATAEQIKEQLAEEFRDFILKKQGVKGLGARIAQLFRNLKKFIETVFLGEKSESFTDELFNRIGNGYYKKHVPYTRELSMAKEGIIDIEDAFAASDSEFRLVKISETQADDVVNEMTYLTLLEMINSEDGVFEITPKKINEILPNLKDGVFETLDNYIAIAQNDGFEEQAADLLVLKQSISDEFSSIEDLFKQKMMSFNITFDEDVDNINKEEMSNRGFNTDVTKVDNFKKSSTAIRLLMSTLPMLNKEVYNNTGDVQEIISTIGGAKLLPTGQVYTTLMNKLYDSRNIDDMISKLRDIAINDVNYAALYKRLTNTSIRQEGVTFANVSKISDTRMLTALWTTVKKQKPTSKVVYVLEDGSVVVGDAELSGVVNQMRDGYYDSIITKIKSNKGFFNFLNNEYRPNATKLNKYSLTDDTSRLAFLNELGIEFSKDELNKLTNNEKKRWNTAVSGIKNTFAKSKGIKVFSKRTLNIGTDLTNLAQIKNRLTNPNVSSTFYNVSGEKVQSYIGVNAASELHNILSKIDNIKELSTTPYAYLLTDVFSKGSSILNRMFASDGSRKEDTEDLFSTLYAGGIVNSQKGTSKDPSRLTFKERLALELNLNLNGIYLNLVPADAGIEWALNMGNVINSKDLDLEKKDSVGLGQIINTFKNYFIAEVNLAKDDRSIPDVEGRKNTDLRFFKGILGETLHDSIVSSIIGENEISAEAAYNANEEKIVNALLKYIQKQTSNYITYLEDFNVIEENVDEYGNSIGTYKFNDVSLPNNMSPRELIREMTANTINYMIANIEMHKLLYSDPYQYKGDELKRIKSFLSPRQSLISGSDEMNIVFNNVWNEGFDKDDVGYTDFTKDYFATASHKDIIGVIDLPNYKQFKETDGGGIIAYKAYRNFRIRINQWNLNEEKQFRYDVAWEKRDKGLDLSPAEVKLLKEGNPQVASAYTSLKPIVSGAKLGYTYNNVVLDKYALYPLSYRVMKELNPESNAIKLYNKMQRENIDYIVFESGRKVGAEKSHATYVESTQQVKEGVSELFESNPELSQIGTQQQYSAYLNTIFPDSKVKDIVYHGTADKNVLNRFTENPIKGLYVGNYELAKAYARGRDKAIFSLIINSKNIDNVSEDVIMEGEKQKGDTLKYSEKDYTEYVVFKPEQIHILGSKQDVEGFKKFASQPTQQSGEGVAVFNDAEYESVMNVPLSIISLQSDVPSKEKALVTRGSQITKLLTLDYLNSGIPEDFDSSDTLNNRYIKWIGLSEQEKENSSPLYKEIKKNENLLKELTKKGYNIILDRLGIKDNGDGSYTILDKSKATKTLRDELFKREVDNNVTSSLNAFLEETSVIEATPAYQQVRNILYSIVDKQIVRPKISGRQLVQIPSALFESNRVAETEINGKKGYTSDVLGFYNLTKDGKEVKFLEDNKNGTYKVLTEEGKEINIPVNDLKTTTMEIMVGRWFESDMSDEDLLNYLNNTEEGQKILSGLAFRIPTQAQNSIDAFRIKKFLPEEFGDNVVVPAGIVEKVGSDFDIDKLSIYLKNVTIDKDGKPKYISFLDDSNSTEEERYVNYVRDTSQPETYRDVIKELNESSEKFETDELINKEFEKVTNIRKEKDDIKQDKEILYIMGYDIFKKLPNDIQEEYINYEKELKSANIEGVEKNLLYKDFTKRRLKNEKNASVRSIYNLLINNYNEVNELYGITEELENKFLNVLSKAKSLKNLNIQSFRFERAKIIAEFSDIETFDKFKEKTIIEQNSKKAIENEYIQSSENLVTNALNFTRLTTPNSSSLLEDISKKIVGKLKEGDAFDYANVNNMLDKRFMSRLRHAFLVGKRGVGIAALNQTFGSLYQRVPMFINPRAIARLSNEDRKYIKDGKIKFETHNKIDIPGVGRVATLSKPTDASGQLISNISSQFVDGYVDISSKGPWIMEMGATPNTVSTFMFLNKIGVPIDTVAYFMNQPIIRDYLNKIETSGYSWLYIDDFITEIKESEKYNVKDGTRTTFDKIPNRNELFETIGKRSLSASERAQQHFMLDEFLKYSKMAGQLFLVTQGSNYDTSRINDPNLVLQKNLQYSKAKNTIFSAVQTIDGKQEVVPAVDAILNSSFIGDVKDSLNQSRDAIGEVLTSDKVGSNVRRILTNVLSPYAKNLRPNEFLKVARKATQDLFDYALHITEDYKQLIQPYLLDDNNVALQVLDFVNEIKADEEHPLYNNNIIRMLQPVPSKRIGKVPNNIKLTNSDSKAYDRNQIIYSFRELRDYLKGGDSKIYQKIIDVAILQSGTSASPISFTDLIPYEDFEKVYNKALSKLDNIPNLDDFEKLGMFQRNNWSNNNVTPYKKASWVKQKNGEWKYNPSMEYISQRIKDEITKKNIPPLMTQSIGGRGTDIDYMVYSWDKENISKSEKERLRREGDFSYINKALFKKVYKPNGEPLLHRYPDKATNQMKEYFVYKAVNALGDSFRAKEFRTTVGKSVIDNGFMKIDKEVSDTTVMNVWYGKKQEFTEEELGTTTSPVTQPTQQFNTVNLGAETAPKGGNVVIDATKGKKSQPGAVVAFRTKGKTEKNMIDALNDNVVGNPFGPYAAIKESNDGTAVTRFLNWLEGTGDTDVMQNYRNALLAKVPELKGKTIYYYKNLGRPSHATALDYFLNKPTQQVSGVKVVNEVYDKIDNDSYSINLRYKGRDYDMVISRDGEIIDPSYYNPNTLRDVDVKSSMFQFTPEDIKNIFSEIEQPTQQAGEVEGSVSDNIKKVIEQVYPNWINNVSNQKAIAAEFKALSLLSVGESSIKDRISFGAEAFKMLQNIKKGKNPFIEGTTVESQLPNLLYAYISGELAKDGISESDMYSNVLGKPTQQSSQEDNWQDEDNNDTCVPF